MSHQWSKENWFIQGNLTVNYNYYYSYLSTKKGWTTNYLTTSCNPWPHSYLFCSATVLNMLIRQVAQFFQLTSVKCSCKSILFWGGYVYARNFPSFSVLTNQVALIYVPASPRHFIFYSIDSLLACGRKVERIEGCGILVANGDRTWLAPQGNGHSVPD